MVHRRLLFHGTMLLILSLLAGVLIGVPGVATPRLALSAHLAGFMGGLLLLALGAAWPQLRFSAAAARRTAALLVASLYANLASTVLGALLGTGQATPIASAGHHAGAVAEAVVSGGLVLSGTATFVALVALAAGFRGRGASAG